MKKFVAFLLLCSMAICGVMASQSFSSCRESGLALVCRGEIMSVSKPRIVVLTQKLINSSGKRLVVKDNYDLKGATVVLPRGFILQFQGGSIDNGTLKGNESSISVSGDKPVLGCNLKISGSWNIQNVYDSWFQFDDSKDFVANDVIKNILALTDDNHSTHIFFNAKRVYHFALQCTGRPDVGNMVSYSIKPDGGKKRHYNEVYEDTYAYLRIFTIPSNTHLTINNKWVMNPTNYGAYFVFWEYAKSNVTIDGSGSIQGDNYGHLYTTPYAGTKYFGEYGHIFRCTKCRNFLFKDITLMDSFGDCILFTGAYVSGESGTRYADGLVLDNVKILRARRNGIALGTRNGVIKNCHFEGCGTKAVKGTNPKSAIDLECDGLKKYNEIGNQNVLIQNCTFVNNEFDIHSYHNTMESYGKVASTIKDCNFTAPLIIKGTYGIRFDNCSILKLSSTETDLHKRWGSKKIEFVNCTFGVLSKSILNDPPKSNKILFSKCKYRKLIQ